MIASTVAATSAWGIADRYFAAAHPSGQLPVTARPAPRVALFSGNYNCVRDGANQALNRLVSHLIHEYGAEVRVYSPTVANPAFAPVGDLVSVPSFPIPGRSEYRIALGLPGAIKADLLNFAPDIIHLSAPDFLGRAAQRFARRQGIPVVASLHTRFETYFRYYGLRWLHDPAERWLHRFYAESDIVLVPTSTLAREMGAAGLGNRVRPWGRGIDQTIFNPVARSDSWRAEHGYDADDSVVLFFGRLVREKGLTEFAETIRLLRARGHRIRPLIIGDGPARGWFAEQLPNAVFTGHLKGEALGRAVASADILINPSLTEAFGNVTLEAMASGLAVICPDVGSTRDLVSDGRTGVLVPDNLPETLADAAARLLKSPEERMRMAQFAGWEGQKYSWARAGEQVVSAYQALLRGHFALRSDSN